MLVGAIVAFGCFVRATFVSFALPACVYILGFADVLQTRCVLPSPFNWTFSTGKSGTGQLSGSRGGSLTRCDLAGALQSSSFTIYRRWRSVLQLRVLPASRSTRGTSVATLQPQPCRLRSFSRRSTSCGTTSPLRTLKSMAFIRGTFIFSSTGPCSSESGSSPSGLQSGPPGRSAKPEILDPRTLRNRVSFAAQRLSVHVLIRAGYSVYLDARAANPCTLSPTASRATIPDPPPHPSGPDCWTFGPRKR